MFDINNFMHSFRNQIKTRWGGDSFHAYAKDMGDPCLYATDYEPLGTYGEDMDDLAGMDDPQSFDIFHNDDPIYQLVFVAWYACLNELTGELTHELKESVKN